MFKLNMQKPEKSVHNQNGDLDIVKIFPTIQGEGPYVGMPSVFVRLAGCNLECSSCDSDYTTDRKLFSVQDILESVALHKHKLVVITGGEPLRQNIAPLINRLLERDHLVQVETNGTLYRDDLPFDNFLIVCSPKTPKIHPELEPYIDCFKYVLEEGQIDVRDGLPITTLGNDCGVARLTSLYAGGEIYVQPLDEGNDTRNKKNLQACLDVCFKFGYRLSYQLHKTLGLE